MFWIETTKNKNIFRFLLKFCRLVTISIQRFVPNKCATYRLKKVMSQSYVELLLKPTSLELCLNKVLQNFISTKLCRVES
jgi:hypothetical protein